MNRIRKVGNHYQVLITPHNSTEAESEYLLSQWTSEEVNNYDVKLFYTFDTAQHEASKYPNINWKFFYLHYVDQYHFLKANIYEAIKTFSIYSDHAFIDILTKYEIKLMYLMMSENEIKNNFFNRVSEKKNLFRPVYDFSDILIFKIICKSDLQANQIKKIISFHKVFKIIKSWSSQTSTTLIGKTPIGSTYQIIIENI